MLIPEILPSARKHGISDKDMMHAFRNAIAVFDLDECPKEVSWKFMKKKTTKSGRRVLQDIENFLAEVEKWDDLSERKLSEEEMSISSALMERSVWDRELCRAVAAARSAGSTWDRIGKLLGISPQAAHKKYAPLMKDAS